MALKVLLLRNKLSAVNATLAQLREQAAALETRESELAADIGFFAVYSDFVAGATKAKN